MTESNLNKDNVTPNSNELQSLKDSEAKSLQDQLKLRRSMTLARAFTRPLPGMAFNPLLKLPRNMTCPCLSGKKFKACCLNKLPMAVPVADAKSYAEQMEKPYLVFETADNMEQVKEFLATFGIKRQA